MVLSRVSPAKGKAMQMSCCATSLEHRLECTQILHDSVLYSTVCGLRRHVVLSLLFKMHNAVSMLVNITDVDDEI